MKALDALDMSGQQIHHAADGSANDDVATYGQVLNLVNGLDYKNGVVAASTANVNIAAPGTTLDAVTLANGDRLLLKDQSTPSQNGIWQFNGSAAALTRPADFVTGTVSQGATVVADAGTANGGTQWTLVTSGAITVGTTALSFTKSGAPGTTYTNGNGLTLTGTTFAIDATKVAQHYAANVGDGASTSIAVAHNLGTTDVQVTVRLVSTKEEVLVDNVATDVNTVTLTFATAPTAAQFRCIVVG